MSASGALLSAGLAAVEWAMTWSVALILVVAAVAAAPRVCWFALGLVFGPLDRWHRRRCEALRRSWPFATTPHVRCPTRPSQTGLQNWRLVCDEGRQRWQFAPGHTQSFVERYATGTEAPGPAGRRETPAAAAAAGLRFLSRLQDADGHFPNDYSGPMFLLPGAVFAVYAATGGDLGRVWGAPVVSEMRRYVANMQNPDGGWGMHSEGHSTMFGSALNYVALRLLGEPADAEAAARARRWIERSGGLESVATWGKAWLAIMGLYSWDGVVPMPPELVLLPAWCPVSLWRLWCHSRMVTIPMSYFYGRRYRCPDTPLLRAVRQELYPQGFDRVRWAAARQAVHPTDSYCPLSAPFAAAVPLLRLCDRLSPAWLRRRALRSALANMKYDDVSTAFICLGPVNKVLHLLAAALEDGVDSAAFRHHCERLDDYLWLGPEGLRVAGYNGSQLWDASFAVQAACAATPRQQEAVAPMMRAAHRYVECAQVLEDPPERERWHRSPTRGCWNFSTRAQGWQVSDCTAEGLRAVLLMRQSPVSPDRESFPVSRMEAAVDIILGLRSPPPSAGGFGIGGWGSYEEIRGPQWLELMNCADLYKDIMVEYTYVECTSSCVQTLCLFRRSFPGYRRAGVDEAVTAGVAAIRRLQRPDGSWYGCWGVCFTYGCFFAVEGLVAAGVPPTDPAMRRCVSFLLGHQAADGGWGEDFNSCVTGQWVPSPDGSQTVNTAWAMIALMGAGGTAASDPRSAVGEALRRAALFVMSRQLASGDWPQERISGVFNGNCAIHYAGYKNVMPCWALGMYDRRCQGAPSE